MIAAWIARIDADMAQALPASQLGNLPIRERIRRLVQFRLDAIEGKEEALRRFILDDLHSGATVYESYGAYNMEKHREIITIVDKSEYQKLMKFINELDPKAFITVYNVSSMKYQPKTGAF